MRTLREHRTARLLSQSELAEKAGVSNKTVVQLEYGRQVPTFRTMRLISQALGVTPGEVTEFAAALEERGKDAA